MAERKHETRKPQNDNGDWEEVASAPIHKFEEAGDELVGTFVRYTDGKYGQMAEIKTEDGICYRVPLDTVLANKLSPELIGRTVKIEYLGKVESQDGSREYKDYKVMSRKRQF